MQPTIDLTNCDEEPIHIPGKIQSHGFLFAVKDTDFVVTHISRNVSEVLSINGEDFLNKPFADLENVLSGKGNIANIIQVLANIKDGADIINPMKITLNGALYNLIISHNQQEFLVEFEQSPAYETELELQRTIGKSFSEIISGDNSFELLNRAALHVKQLIGYDRVMIYQFNTDGHGEVIAEAKNDHIESLMGLHFPASDIPRQARELYKKQLTRIIADVNDTTADIISFKTEALDLSCSELRAVSPVHIQYLKNMEVQASFSISLVRGDHLWGLIACHNDTPKFIDYSSRQASKLIGKILSYSYDFIKQSEERDNQKDYLITQEKLFSQLRESRDIADALTNQVTTLKDVIESSGAAFLSDGQIHLTGDTPSEAEVRDLAKWLSASNNESMYCTSELSVHFDAATSYKSVASGLLATIVSKEQGEYIMWFRPEITKQINWAGDPEKPVEIGKDGNLTISPRTSFASWSQLIKGSSKDWLKTEKEFAQKILSEVISAANQRAAETRFLNEKLKTAYEELDKFSYTISHDLKNPLAVIKSYSEILEYHKTLDDRSKMIVKKILASAVKMNHLIDEVLKYSQLGREYVNYSIIKMEPLLAELQAELPVGLKVANLDFNISGTPNVYGDPTMILQVFTNLLSNAIKYSSKTEKPEVSVSGNDDGAEIIYTIVDNGIGIDPSAHSKIFELFSRLHPVSEFEGTGVGLAIVKRMVEKHKGRIWLESEPGKGTTFYVAFPKPESLN
jgi:light-regulated signal transduction histidine kinase (bacteriophytochrome)